MEGVCNSSALVNMMVFFDAVEQMVEEAQNCEIKVPAKLAAILLVRIVNGFVEEEKSPLSFVKNELGEGVANAVINSIVGSFAGSLLVSAKNMSKEEAENYLDSLDAEVGKA